MSQRPPDGRGALLLHIARGAIARHFGVHSDDPADEEFLHRPGASFVTLMQADRLRGCIGSLEARRNLREDVVENATAAAFRDPRFPPLASEELMRTRIEVSLLSPLELIGFADERDALDRLCPGADGLVLECGGRRGTFLPQVWNSLPEPATFLAELKRKAGLPADFWDTSVRLYRYRVEKWSEPA